MRDIEFIEGVLEEASALVREKYGQRSHVHVTSKTGPTDLLTDVDLAVQDHIVARLASAFPDDAIAAEERDLDRNPNDPDQRCWVIDPIDGTQNFMRGFFPAFGISLGLAIGGRSVAGGVAMPITQDLFLAERGSGAFRNGARLHVSDVSSVALARIEVDFSGPQQRSETLRRASKLICKGGQIRCTSATVVGMCSIATGNMDAFIHVGPTPYDYAASQVIVEEAGGKCTRFDGSPLFLFDGKRGVVASNGILHEELLAVLALEE